MRNFSFSRIRSILLFIPVFFLLFSCKKDNNTPPPETPELKLWCGDFENRQCVLDHWSIDTLTVSWSIVDSSYNGSHSLYMNVKSPIYFQMVTTVEGIEPDSTYEIGFHTKLKSEPQNHNPSLVMVVYNGNQDYLQDFVVYSDTAQAVVDVDWMPYIFTVTNDTSTSLTLQIAANYLGEVWLDQMYIKKL